MKMWICWSTMGFLLLTGSVSRPGAIDRDRHSKAYFTFLMVLFSLAKTGAAPQEPLITVSVNEEVKQLNSGLFR